LIDSSFSNRPDTLDFGIFKEILLAMAASTVP
jgi:hypothetical protein